MSPELIFLRQHMDAMRQQVLTALPEEACGLVGGKDSRAELIIPISNSQHSPTRFFMEPQELYFGLKLIDALDLELVGVYHSHPAGPPTPSDSDTAEYGYPEAAALIWSPAGGAWQVRGFMIEGLTIKEVSLKIDPRA